jgi:hypothetical protein
MAEFNMFGMPHLNVSNTFPLARSDYSPHALSGTSSRSGETELEDFSSYDRVSSAKLNEAEAALLNNNYSSSNDLRMMNSRPDTFTSAQRNEFTLTPPFSTSFDQNHFSTGTNNMAQQRMNPESRNCPSSLSGPTLEVITGTQFSPSLQSNLTGNFRCKIAFNCK